MRKYFSKISADSSFPMECAALAFTGAVMATTYSVFGTNLFQVILFGLLEMLLTIPFFLLCRYTNSHRVVGGLICVVVYGGATFAGMYLSMVGYMQVGVGFMEWLVTDASEESSAPVYLFLLAVGGALLFGSAIYYFVVIRYRFAMLVMISLLPCVLYAKAIHDVNNGYLILLAGMNIVACVLRRRYDRTVTIVNGVPAKPLTTGIKVKKDFRGEFYGWLTVLGFVVIVMIVCAAIPKQKEAKYYNMFEDTFLGGDTTSPIQGISADLTEISGNADGFNINSNRRMYTLTGKNPVYVKTQHFDVYNYEKDYWTALPEWKEPVYTAGEYANLTEGLSLVFLQRAMVMTEKLEPGFAEKYNLLPVLDIKTSMNGGFWEVDSLNFGASYYIAPEGAVLLIPQDKSEAMVTRAGTFVRTEGRHPDEFGYRISYTTTQDDMAEWAVGGGANYSDEEMIEILTEMSEILGAEIEKETAKLSEGEELNNKELLRAETAVNSFLFQLEEALDYERDTHENAQLVSDEVAQLAAKIIEGCEYDWEKAYALQEYFHSGSFKYDLNYRAPDKSVEYFLFTSKRGTCSDYATAYVLMARSVGLSARYTEGYITESSGRRNLYYIKESKSHAFPEVYIQGTGWIIFEPTSGVVENSEGGIFSGLFNNLRMDFGLMGVIVIFGAIIGAIVFGVALLIPVITEAVFAASLGRGRKNARDAYLRLLKKAEHRRFRRKTAKAYGRNRMFAKVSASTRAPKEVLSAFAEVGIDITALIKAVEDMAYSADAARVADAAGAADAVGAADSAYSADSAEIKNSYKAAAKIFRY